MREVKCLQIGAEDARQVRFWWNFDMMFLNDWARYFRKNIIEKPLFWALQDDPKLENAQNWSLFTLSNFPSKQYGKKVSLFVLRSIEVGGQMYVKMLIFGPTDNSVSLVSFNIL